MKNRLTKALNTIAVVFFGFVGMTLLLALIHVVFDPDPDPDLMSSLFQALLCLFGLVALVIIAAVVARRKS